MSGRIAGLDVMRGIAILLVMLRHAFPGVFPGAGVVGVVMFFTLSGYLITGVLAKELERMGKVDYRRFYLRRARRLLPALVALVLVFAVVTWVFDPLGDRDRLPLTAAVLLTFTGNLPIGGVSAAAFHGWTLATEEQFYLLWPALLAFTWVRGRVGVSLVATGLAALTACVATLIWLWPNADNAYALPTSWFVCFVIGATTRLRGSHVPRWAVPVALVAARQAGPRRGCGQLRLRHRLRRRVVGRPRGDQHAARLLVRAQARVRPSRGHARRHRAEDADVAGAEGLRRAPEDPQRRSHAPRPAQARPQVVRDPPRDQLDADPPLAARRHHSQAGHRPHRGHDGALHRRHEGRLRPGPAGHRLPAPGAGSAGVLRRRAAPPTCTCRRSPGSTKDCSASGSWRPIRGHTGSSTPRRN
nr:acyltransferase family protein [Saccharothrix sp. ALI-22-I]